MSTDSTNASPEVSLNKRLQSVSRAYFPLAFISFGGPQAHIALFHDLFVDSLQWVSAKSFVELFAIATSLPGPASTQLAYAIALVKHGFLPALASFFVWSLPGMMIMTGFGVGVTQLGASIPPALQSFENGLSSAAVGLVALAAYKLGKKILQDRVDSTLALVSLVLAIHLRAQAWLFPTLMVGSACVSFVAWQWSRTVTLEDEERPLVGEREEEEREEEEETLGFSYSARTGSLILMFWGLLLILSIFARNDARSGPLQVMGTFYFIGSIIFGGGPVVIPLLQGYVSDFGWMSPQEFLIGLALVNALPGPMFNIAAFCGALALRSVGGIFASNHLVDSVVGGVLWYVGIFAPGLLLMTGLMPFWRVYRKWEGVKHGFKGVNASAVGLVFASVYMLSIKAIGGRERTETIAYPIYMSISAGSFVLVESHQWPAPVVILLGGLLGWLGQ